MTHNSASFPISVTWPSRHPYPHSVNSNQPVDHNDPPSIDRLPLSPLWHPSQNFFLPPLASQVFRHPSPSAYLPKTTMTDPFPPVAEHSIFNPSEVSNSLLKDLRCSRHLQVTSGPTPHRAAPIIPLETSSLRYLDMVGQLGPSPIAFTRTTSRRLLKKLPRQVVSVPCSTLTKC